MTDGVQELLDKSERSINAASLLLRDGYYDFAANQAITEAGKLLAEIKLQLAAD